MAPDEPAGATASAPAGIPGQVEARLSRLPGLPVGEHVEVFDAVHRQLQDALATLDEV